MVDRISALHGHYNVGRFGVEGETGVILEDMQGLVLHQIVAWPDTLAAVATKSAQVAGTQNAPGPCAAESGSNGTLLRIEPLKWWVIGTEAPELSSDEGSTLDLSHSRTHLSIAGAQATIFLNRYMPIDLRQVSFPVGSVASTAMHHVGVTLWRSEHGYELFIPRGFARALWEVFQSTAAQFGAEIV